MHRLTLLNAMLRGFFLWLCLASSALADEPTIKSGDTVRLQIAILPNEGTSISNFYRVDEEGTIQLPYVGKIKVAGLNCADAARAIDDLCIAKEIISRRTAEVRFETPDPFVVVSGQIKRPDKIATRPDLTLLQAINDAGGFTDSANQQRVTLTRAGSREVLRCNVTKIIKKPSLDIPVYAGDKIQVEAQTP